MEFLGRLAYEMHLMKPLVPTYIHLLLSAIFPIYTAAHASLARPPSAAPPKRSKETTDLSDLQDEEISPTIETLTPSDAILFPVLAGTTLASLYFILKWLKDPALLNYYLGLYFAVVGLFFQVKFVKDVLATTRSVVLPNQYSYRHKLWKLDAGKRRFVAVGSDGTKEYRTSPLPSVFSILFKKYNSIIWSLRIVVYTRMNLKFSIWKLINVVTVIDTLDLVGLVIATPLVAYHTFVDKPWFLTNLLGFSFCYGSLQITTPGTSWTGTLLLCALFFYDIYFVFFTPMMVTVATKLDVPIKLLFPRPDGCIKPKGVSKKSEIWENFLQCLAKKRTMAMLGLGDIVIPGMMLAFALRFDLYLYYRKLSALSSTSKGGNKPDEAKEKDNEKATYLPATGSWGERFWTSKNLHSAELQAKQFPKIYFTASVVGYILGLIVTVVAMQISRHAQPALLYLVPGVLISLWGVAVVKGDLKTLWKYTEVPEEDDDKTKDKAKGQDKKIEDKTEDKIEDAKETGEKTVGSIDDTTTKTEKPIEDKSTQEQQGETKVKPEPEFKKDKDQKSSESDTENHIIYFSLSIIKPKPKPKNPDPKPTQNQIEDKPVSAETKSNNSTEEWSSDDDDTDHEAGGLKHKIAGVQTIDEIFSKAAEGTATGTKLGTGTGNGEPAMKRRRKA